jgi:4-hydroxy-L-threonine phosphate dehydrogenase PdxA
MKPVVAIATGDPGGIGPEISIKAARDARVRAVCEPLVVGDRGALEAHARACGLSLDGVAIRAREQLRPGELQIGAIAAAHGRAALDSARAAIEGALAGEYQAVVAAPHSETAIHAAGVPFDGYPSFVARTAGLAPEDGVLMLCFEWQGREVRIAGVGLGLRQVDSIEALQPDAPRRIPRRAGVVAAAQELDAAAEVFRRQPWKGGRGGGAAAG